MGELDEQQQQHWGWGCPPYGSPSALNTGKEEVEQYWRHFDSSLNSVSFGFLATAVLISMFLLLAIFERFFITSISPSPPTPQSTSSVDVESQQQQQMQLNNNNRKFIPLPSPKISQYHAKARELSVLMPGDHIPTFIAQPTPDPDSTTGSARLASPRLASPRLASPRLASPIAKRGPIVTPIN